MGRGREQTHEDGGLLVQRVDALLEHRFGMTQAVEFRRMTCPFVVGCPSVAQARVDTDDVAPTGRADGTLWRSD